MCDAALAETFADTVPNYPMLPRVTKNLAGQDIDRHAQRANATVVVDATLDRELTDDELLLTSPIVYGFSFSDKQWCACRIFLEIFSCGIFICAAAESLLSLAFLFTVEFIVERVERFTWNDEAFEQLVIPPKHKQVLKTLVESHNAGSSRKFDDFVTGKGHGLVINLFGNPGTGKSLTAEAMSECRYLSPSLAMIRR